MVLLKLVPIYPPASILLSWSSPWLSFPLHMSSGSELWRPSSRNWERLSSASHSSLSAEETCFFSPHGLAGSDPSCSVLLTCAGFLSSSLFLCLTSVPPSVMQKHNKDPHCSHGFFAAISLSKELGGYLEKSDLGVPGWDGTAHGPGWAWGSQSHSVTLWLCR